MLILALATLALVIVVFGYYSLLVIQAVTGWLKPGRLEQQHTDTVPHRLTTLELRFATLELGRQPGFGDE